ncbi:MAG: TolC family outer membrane protein [Pseudomonadota bacterium]
MRKLNDGLFSRGNCVNFMQSATGKVVHLARISLAAASMMITGQFFTTAMAADFWDIYQQALENDSIYRAASFEYESAKLALPLSETNFSPSIVSNASIGKARSDASGDSVTGDSSAVDLNFGLPLYNRTDRIGVRQAQLAVASAELNFANARDDLILRVADRYFNLLSAVDSLEVARLEKVAIKRQMDLADERLDVGLGTRTDLFDAKARFEQAKADEIQAQIIINNAVQALKQIIGDTPPGLAGLAADAPLELPSPNNLAHWIGQARRNNLLLQVEQVNVLIANEEIEKQRVAKSPTVSLNANHRWSESPSSFNTGSSTTSTISVDLSLPLYLGGATRLRTRQAGFDYNAAEQALENRRRQVASDTTSAFLEVTSGVSQVNALAEAIRAGENALQAKEEGFSAGLTTNLDVLDAQRDLSRSRSNYLRARYNHILSILRLARFSGQLGEQTVKRVNRWLDPNNIADKLSNRSSTSPDRLSNRFDLAFRQSIRNS